MQDNQLEIEFTDDTELICCELQQFDVVSGVSPSLVHKNFIHLLKCYHYLFQKKSQEKIKDIYVATYLTGIRKAYFDVIM